jgi:hypothetical protein
MKNQTIIDNAHFRHVRGQLVQVRFVFIANNLSTCKATHRNNHIDSMQIEDIRCSLSSSIVSYATASGSVTRHSQASAIATEHKTGAGASVVQQQAQPDSCRQTKNELTCSLQFRSFTTAPLITSSQLCVVLFLGFSHFC